MREIIRVLLVKPNSEQTLMIPLQRPLEWESVLRDFYQTIMDTDDDAPAALLEKCSILVHPNKSKTEKGVVIRKTKLDRSIRDGDLLSLEGFVTEDAASLIADGVLDTFVDSLDIDFPPLDVPEATFEPLGDLQAAMPLPEPTPVAAQVPVHAPAAINRGPPIGNTAINARSRKTKRGRSLSSKFWLVNKLAQSEKITKEQKDALKMMLIMDDSIIHAAFDEYEETGDITKLLNAQLNSRRLPPASADPFNFDLTQNIENGLDLLTMKPDVPELPELPTSAGLMASSNLNALASDPTMLTVDDALDGFINSTLSELPMPIGHGDNNGLPSALPGDLHGMDEWLKD